MEKTVFEIRPRMHPGKLSLASQDEARIRGFSALSYKGSSVKRMSSPSFTAESFSDASAARRAA